MGVSIAAVDLLWYIQIDLIVATCFYGYSFGHDWLKLVLRKLNM